MKPLLFGLFLVACGGGADTPATSAFAVCTTDAAAPGQEHHVCAFSCGVAACYVPIDMACNSMGFVIDDEQTIAISSGCAILFHCR